MSYPAIAGEMSEDGLSGFRFFQVTSAAQHTPSLSSRGPTRDAMATNSRGAVGGWVTLAVVLGLLYFWVDSEPKQGGAVVIDFPAATSPPHVDTPAPASMQEIRPKRQEAAQFGAARKPMQDAVKQKAVEQKTQKVVEQKVTDVANEMPSNEPAISAPVLQSQTESQEAPVDLRVIREFKSKM